MAGPRPTPTAILKARGSWRADTRPNEPTLPVEAPACPAWLKGEARAKWFELVPLLVDLGVLTKLDSDALARYCRTWQDWREAESPKLRKDLGALLCRMETEFGMTPASRPRIRADKPKAATGGLGKERLFTIR